MSTKRGSRPPSTRAGRRPATRTPALKAELKSMAKVRSTGPTSRPLDLAYVATLVDAVRAAPADDELRLVLADAFEVAGELERARHIRLQVAVATGSTDPQTLAHARRAQVDRDNQLRAYASGWISERGLVWHLEARADNWLAHGASWFEQEPITSIGVCDPSAHDEDLDVGPLLAKLADQRWLQHVTAIEFPASEAGHGRWQLDAPDVVVELLSSPHLRNLTRLAIHDSRSAIRAARSCELPNLRSLIIHLVYDLAGDDIVEAWQGRMLTELELHDAEAFTPEAGRLIAESGWPLERLMLKYCDLEEAGLRAIAHAPTLAPLRELVLDAASLDDDAVRALAASPYLRSLHTLGIQNNRQITDDGLVMLAESPVLASVRRLKLFNTSVTGRGLATLPDHVQPIFLDG